MDFNKDYYTILGLSKGCSDNELKAAYRRLAKQYHPDRMPEGNPVNMQAINEAYEVLGDAAKRSIYDEYLSRAEAPVSAPVRSYERTFTVSEVEKIYLKGRIHVKFWADALEDNTGFLQAISYRLQPSEVIVYAKEEDLGIREPATEWTSAVEETELFCTPVAQPVRCEIEGASDKTVYLLNLTSIRVANIELVDIVKHNEQSLGTLVGDIYAELIHTRFREKKEWVTECDEPVEKEESKEENHWGKSSAVPSQRNSVRTFSSHGKFNGNVDDWKNWWSKQVSTSWPKRKGIGGCGFWSLFLFLFFLFLAFLAGGVPVLGLLATVALLAVGGVFLYWIRHIIPVLYLMAVAGLIFASFWSLLREARISPKVSRKPAYDTLMVKQVTTPNDTLQVHTIRWKDYDSNYYEMELPVRLQDLRSSGEYHQWISRQPANDISSVYESLIRHDEQALEPVYESFDSLRVAYSLDEQQFANAMVSCIQSVPYYLVLNGPCTDVSNADGFVRDYLQQCTQDCCIGYMGFGVRSPIEFLSDLKGDCDTRALLLFALFKRFNYDVALVTSEHYRHAAIAVGAVQAPQGRFATFRVGDKDLYAWETTAAGFRIGELPERVNHLRHWQISLLYKKVTP